jgi:Raf kinase inhibitor-like YbhB/YbcL family protein
MKDHLSHYPVSGGCCLNLIRQVVDTLSGSGCIEMRFVRTLAICTVVLIAGIASAAAAQTNQAAPPKPGLTMTSMAFEDGGIIPLKYTQRSQNPVSPDLEWTNVPASTVSFVLIVHDPDVAILKGTHDSLHWMVFNVPGTATGLAEGIPASPQLPDGTIQAKNSGGGIGFMGPGAGPAGPSDHFTFELYALDIKLTLGQNTTRSDILLAIDGHVLGKGVLIGRSHR